MQTTTTYHIYFKGQVIFKNLDQDEFDTIWKRIYRSYHTDDISYCSIQDNPIDQLEEASY
jgi:hypothetical protein